MYNPFPTTIERLLYLTLLLVFLALTIGVGALFIAVQNQLRLTGDIHDAVTEIKTDKMTTDKLVLDHINCIAIFLSQPNRAQVRISDIENCKIVSE